MKIKSQIFGIFLLLMIASCSSHHDKTTLPGPPPEAAVLVLPAQSSICVNGTALSAIQSNVLFQWKKAANTDTYLLTVKNLVTGISQTQSTSTEQATLSLARNMPFTWTLTCQSTHNTQTAVSDSWKFYNAGDGITSYAPFPADQLSPGLGDYADAGTISLTWAGSDPDNDISFYDVYFGTTVAPPLLQKGLVTNSTSVTIISKTKYYWKVVTHDSPGNSSESETITFNSN
jgi:hypothetical protein